MPEARILITRKMRARTEYVCLYPLDKDFNQMISITKLDTIFNYFLLNFDIFAFLKLKYDRL